METQQKSDNASRGQEEVFQHMEYILDCGKKMQPEPVYNKRDMKKKKVNLRPAQEQGVRNYLQEN